LLGKLGKLLNYNINVSRHLFHALVFLHSGAMLAAVAAGLDSWVAAAAGLLIVPSLVVSLRQHALRSASGAVVAIAFDTERDANCRIWRRGQGETVSCRAQTLFVSRFLIVMTVVCPDRLLDQAVIVAPDAIEADGFRRLRAHLGLVTLGA